MIDLICMAAGSLTLSYEGDLVLRPLVVSPFWYPHRDIVVRQVADQNVAIPVESTYLRLFSRFLKLQVLTSIASVILSEPPPHLKPDISKRPPSPTS